jgi:uncharacterized protein (DUF1330 family)
MAAYIVGQLDVKNTNWQQEYGPQARALLHKYGGKVIVGPGCAIERLEGRQPLPTAMFILEFPSLEQAKAWYTDPEYAALIDVRQSGADAEIVVLTHMRPPEGGRQTPESLRHHGDESLHA